MAYQQRRWLACSDVGLLATTLAYQQRRWLTNNAVGLPVEAERDVGVEALVERAFGWIKAVERARSALGASRKVVFAGQNDPAAELQRYLVAEA